MGGLENVPIDDLVQQVRLQCCDKIQNLYSKIQLLNLQQIDVDQLYVDVYLLERISSETFATIPSLLRNSDLGNDFDRFGLGQRGNRNGGFKVANEYDRLMILGKPGSGKTTFLRHLAVACCQGKFQSEKIPILIELRSIKNTSQFNLLSIIHKEFDLPDQEQTKQILKEGKVLIFLDGLDEVPSESRRDVQKNIDEFSRDSQYYKNRFILSCRTQTTEYSLENFNYVEVADFNKVQVGDFAHNWFTKLAKTPQQGEKLRAEFLEKLILPENKQIADLAVTPILLSLTCWIFNESEYLPSKRSELYKRGIKLLLKQWDEKRNIQRDLGGEDYRNLSPEDKQKLLSYVAYRKFTQEQYALFEESEIQKYIAEYSDFMSTNDSQAVLKAIEAHHGLLIKRAQDIDSAEGIYSFSHLTFQEYFAAQYIVENYKIEESFKKYVTDTRWREVFLLAAELDLLSLMQKDAQSYIIDTPKLQALLSWADGITSGTGGHIKFVGKRAIAITIVIAFANANADANAIANAIAIAIVDANANVYAEAIAKAIAEAKADAIVIAYAIDEAIKATSELEKSHIFNHEEFTNLAVNLEKLKSKIPNDEQPREKRNEFAEELRMNFLNAFNLTPEMIDLSQAELEVLDNKYLYTNMFILDYKKAAVGDTSPPWWQEIEDRMLKPNL